MGEFFKSWRRKMGCVTLVMACVFAAGWERSLAIFDVASLNHKDATHRVISTRGELRLIRIKPALQVRVAWISGDASKHPATDSIWDKYDMEWRWDWAMFHFGAGKRKFENTRFEAYMFPYWSIVIPLIAISAYLLFTKPRTLAKPKTSEPVPADGA